MRRHFLLRVVAAYLLCRVFSVVLLAVVSHYQTPVPAWTGPHPDYFSMTVLWDGSWYRQIAEHGYPVPLPTDPTTGGLAQNAWAFYPLFPMVCRALMAMTGLGFPVVGSSVAMLCGFGAAALMAVLLRDLVGPRVALAAVAVWASFPASPALQIAYTESPAILLLCAVLLALRRERWLLAGALALALGVTRPIAVPVVAVALVAVVSRLGWVGHHRERGRERVRAGEGLAMLSLLVACGVAGVIWPAYAWWRTGSRTAYTDTMATWRSSGHVTPFKPWLDIARYVGGDTLGPVGLALLAVALVVVVAGPWACALGAQLRTWSLAYPAYLAAVLEPWTSIFRYALPLFPVAVVAVGGGWVDRRARRLGWRAGVLVAAGLVLQVWWVWSLLRFVPPTDYPP